MSSLGMRAQVPLWLRLPAFGAAVGVLYWSMVLGSVTHCIKTWSFKRRRNDTFDWAVFVASLFGVRALKTGDGELTTEPKCMLLANHRCWADFFLDHLVTRGRASILGRWAVMAVFPVFALTGYVLHAVFFFKRTIVKDKERFNCWIDKQIAGSDGGCIMVYPEGTRSTTHKPLPLKRGMLAYAFSRKLPVQIVITANKEDVLSEKHLHVGLRRTIVVGYSEVIHSATFSEFGAFAEHIAIRFQQEWDRVYSAKPSDCQPLLAEKVCFDYSWARRVQLAGLSLTGATLLVLLGLLCWRTVATLLMRMGSMGKVVSILSAGYTAASVIGAFVAEHPPPHSKPHTA